MWVEFKHVFSATWLNTTFEVDVMTAWYELNATKCKSVEDFNKKFCQALLPVSSYQEVPLIEPVERYCCGVPKKGDTRLLHENKGH